MSATLQRRVSRLLSSKGRFDAADVVEASAGLSDFVLPGDNSRDNRRRLRSLLERRSVHIHASLVHSFAAVDAQLSGLSTSLHALLALCESTLEHLSQVKAHNAALVQRTALLQADEAALEAKAALVESFLAHFTLSEEDARALDEGEIDEEFFAALGRIGVIREACAALLVGSFHQRVGLDILDGLARRLERGYERLYRSVQQQAAALTALPPPSSPFIPALALLRAMPVYYEHVLAEITQAHRLHLIQRFMAAMTRGEPGQRPIDLHAHDPVRYVSDMLAWTHQQVANERDFIAQLTAMLDDQQRALAQPQQQHSTAQPTSEASRAQLLSAVFEGLSRLLRTRLEQALQSQPTAETAFRVWNVVAFYQATVAPLFPPEATFRATLHAMTDSARAHFFDVMKRQGDKLSAQPPQPMHDLSPPPVLTEGLSQLTTILAIASQSSLSPASSVELAPVLAASLDPLLTAIGAAAAALSLEDQCVYAINNLDLVVRTLRKYDAARGRVEVLSFRLDGEVERLVAQHYTAAMDKCGMRALVERMRAEDQREREGAPRRRRCEVEGLDEAAVAAALRSFYAALMSIGSFLVPQADRLLQSSTRRSCRQHVAIAIAAAYAELWAMLRDDVNGYGAQLQRALTHTPEQIDLVLELRRATAQSRAPATPAAAASRASPTPLSSILAAADISSPSPAAAPQSTPTAASTSTSWPGSASAAPP